METTEKCTSMEEVGTETEPLISRMEDFLDYACFIAEYSSLVRKFPKLPKEAIESIDAVLERALEFKNCYESSLLEETVEEILKRADAINSEIENLSYVLALCEIGLDRFLIFAQTEPEIISKFLVDGFSIFPAANC